MGQWGALTPFETAVRWLSPDAKKAMYAAAAGNLIKRNTWNGCAFNQAGFQIGSQVRTYSVAAQAFNMPEKSVVNFIRQWDHLPGTDEECTELLKTTIEKIGIFGARGTLKNFSIKVYTPAQKAEENMEKELKEMIEAGQAEDVEFAKEVADLLANSSEAYA